MNVLLSIMVGSDFAVERGEDGFLTRHLALFLNLPTYDRAKRGAVSNVALRTFLSLRTRSFSTPFYYFTDM